MACLLLAITKACITLGLATNGIGKSSELRLYSLLVGRICICTRTLINLLSVLHDAACLYFPLLPHLFSIQGMIDMMSKFQHDGNDLFQRGTEYAAALLTVSYMAKLAVDGLSHVALFRVGRQSVLQNSQSQFQFQFQLVMSLH